MFGFNQRQSSKKKDKEERRKRGQTNKPAQPNSSSKAVAQRPTGAPQRAGGANLNTVQAPKGLPKPESPKTSRFYTNSEGSTGDGVRPSSARGVATTPPQKGGFPANPNPPRLPPPSSSGQPGPQSNNFYTNKEGQTTRGFGTSSSRAVVPSGPRTGTSLVPVDKPASKPGAGAGSSTAREPNYKARAEGKARAAKDTAKYEAERAAQDKKFKNAGNEPSTPKKGSATKAPAGFRSRMPTRFGVAGPVSALATGIPEARDVARVAGDEDSTKLDVANQVAEGTGRTAATLAGGALGAKAGAAIGGFGGPFAPITVPIGGFVGGGIGAGLGWWGADEAIEAGRELTGTDPSSPVDRVDPQAVPVPMDQPPQAAPREQQPDSESVGTLQPMPEQQGSVGTLQPMPEQQLTNDVTFDPETNSFSGGVVGRGYTVNGQAQGGPNIGNPQSDQNRQAIDSLMARTPEFGAGGFQPSQDNRPNFYIGQDSSVDDRIERRMLQSASTPLKGAQNGQLTASQRRTMENHLSGKRQDATTRATNRSNNQTNLQTAQVNQQGQNQRAGARLSIDQSRLEGEQQERGFRIRQANQIESLREQYQAAETEEDRSAIAEQLRVLNGDGDEQKGQYKAQMVDVPVDPSRPELGTRQVPYTFDPRTGQWQAGVEQQTGSAPSQNHINALKNNPSLAAQFDEWYGPGAAAQYSGAN